MNENERTGGDSGGEPPRRRRGRRSAPAQRTGQRPGQRSAHKGDAHKSSAQKGTSQRGGAKGTPKNGQKNSPKNGQRSSGGGHNRGRANQPRKRNQNNRNHTNRTRPARTAARTSSDPMYDMHSELPVSVETSAGGLILSGLAEAVRKDGSVDLSSIYVALIGRLDRRGRLLWSMPKGHIEPDESTVATAEREVWEETGVAGSVIAELGTIDYWFVSEGVRIHKTVHHYLLRFEDGDLNDEDPEVTEVQWLPVHQLVERLAYADERRLARDAFDLLPELAHAEVQAGRVTPR